MRKLLFILLSLFIGTSVFASVAGEFYPSNKNDLSKTIDSYLKGYKYIKGEGDLISIIVPHAGYQFSGKVSAYAYKQLIGRNYDTVIVLGVSHKTAFDGIAILPKGEYSTLLGNVKIDTEVTSKLMSASPRIKYVEEVFDREHSVDVQVPFLQKTLNNFKIVPIIFGTQSLDDIKDLANAIVNSTKGKKVLIVASTDLSHFNTYETAVIKDNVAIDAISRGDIGELVMKVTSGECEMCGYAPVISTMLISDALGANSYEVLKYMNSGDVTGDKTSVVGYLSAAIYKRPVDLDDLGKQSLLDIARKTLESYVKYGIRPELGSDDKVLREKAGVFVSLTNQGVQRGCIGYILPVKPLYIGAADMAIAAGTGDIRFTPVTTEELSSIKIEISVLSTPKKISSTNEVVVGKSGLIIVNGNNLGVLLPQVAIENKWNRAEFLDNVCYKAGLSTEAISDPSTQLFTFTADSFSEEK